MPYIEKKNTLFISVDRKKAYDKINHTFMIKTLKLIKGIYEKFPFNIYLIVLSSKGLG